jgi:hypothetical protein
MINEIIVDIRPSSAMEWKEAKEIAAKSKKITWVFETGLFSGLRYPLDHEGQFSTIQLGLSHFMETLGKEFASSTQKVVLYQGLGIFAGGEFFEQCRLDLPLDSSSDPKESQLSFTLHALNLMADYLNKLGKAVPEAWGPYLQWDPWPHEPFYEALLTHPEKWGSLKIAKKGSMSKWDTSFPSDTAIYWPPAESLSSGHYLAMKKAIGLLPHARWIPEEKLTTSWEGLNTLWVLQESLSPQGARMVAGFEAAGGEVRELIGLSQQYT